MERADLFKEMLGTSSGRSFQTAHIPHRVIDFNEMRLNSALTVTRFIHEAAASAAGPILRQ